MNIFGILTVGFLIFEIFLHKKDEKMVKSRLFLLVWFFSPLIMLILGVHNAPWFWIGRPMSIILMATYLISRIRPRILITLIAIFIVSANLLELKDQYGIGQQLLGPDPSSVLSRQVAVMKYTYQKSNGEKFAIDTVTNPLYINAVWAWNYDWYYSKYGYKPDWLGGDQLHPYDTLAKSTRKEKYFFLIIDETPRIPSVYRQNAISHFEKIGKFVEQKEFSGIEVMVYKSS